MSRVDIQLFGSFQIKADGHELPLAPSIKELLALLVIVAGHRITAKSLWKLLYESKGIKYNGAFYTARINDMKSEIAFFRISEIISSTITPLRACRLNLNAVHCDYYDMLDGKITLGSEAAFLPEYEWAKAFYKKKWADLHLYLNSLNL